MSKLTRKNPKSDSFVFCRHLDVPREVVDMTTGAHDLEKSLLTGVINEAGDTRSMKMTREVLLQAVGDDERIVPLHRRGEKMAFIWRVHGVNAAARIHRVDLLTDLETSIMDRKNSPEGLVVKVSDDEQGSLQVMDYPTSQSNAKRFTLQDAVIVLNQIDLLPELEEGKALMPNGAFVVRSIDPSRREVTVIKL